MPCRQNVLTLADSDQVKLVDLLLSTVWDTSNGFDKAVIAHIAL